jgi:hypothetical protein
MKNFSLHPPPPENSQQPGFAVYVNMYEFLITKLRRRVNRKSHNKVMSTQKNERNETKLSVFSLGLALSKWKEASRGGVCLGKLKKSN